MNGSQFITELMPPFPVYQELLPAEAIAVIGKPHADAVPARKLLEREGFSYEGTIDIFDGGPVLQCKRANIASVKATRVGVVAKIVEEHDTATSKPGKSKQSATSLTTSTAATAREESKANDQKYPADREPMTCILSNRRLPDYRLVLGPVVFNGEQGVILCRHEAELLGVGVGDSVRVLGVR